MQEMQQTTESVAQLKKRMHKQIFLILLCVTVSGLSAGAFITRAWYASNREVKSENSSITSSTPSAALFIRPAGTTTKDYAISVQRSVGASLFPISTYDLDSWYYASSFKFGAFTVTSDSATVTAAPVADDFTKADITVAEGSASGKYTNAIDDIDGGRTAYYYAKDNIYTSNGSLDVYLDADDPITVELNSETSKENFLKAVRVGLKYDDTFIVYAPAAETSHGNTDGDSAASGETNVTFKAIKARNGATTGSTWELVDSTATTDLSGRTAKAGSAGTYTPVTGATALFTADETGKDVEIYVWLEGTDGEALLGSSDGDTNGINVNVNYVGVETTSGNS